MTTIFGRYRLGDLIGSGSFGQVYVGTSIRSKTKVAIKVDDKYGNKTTLTHEAKLLNYLRGPNYIPALRYYGTNPETNTTYLVMNLLGKSLEDVKQERGIIGEKDAIEVGLQCLRILKYVHGKSIIHRDIKPENFLFGTDSDSKTLNIIDFGLSKKYIDSNNNHITMRENRPTVGTMRYTSADIQSGIEASRRDDMISLAYMLIYLQMKHLPWQGIKKPPLEREAEICRLKKQTTSSSLCSGLNDCFLHLLLHAKNIKFDAEPNYIRMEKKFISALNGVKSI